MSKPKKKFCASSNSSCAAARRCSISHRISTVRDADMIVYLRGGAIIEQGTHERTLGAARRLFQLYRRQSLEREVDDLDARGRAAMIGAQLTGRRDSRQGLRRPLDGAHPALPAALLEAARRRVCLSACCRPARSCSVPISPRSPSTATSLDQGCSRPRSHGTGLSRRGVVRLCRAVRANLHHRVYRPARHA